MSLRALVAGIGNIFHTDDGFGPAVVARLASTGAELPAGVRVVDYGIRGVHLAYDLLNEWDLLVLVDAVPDRGEPGRLGVLEIGRDDVPVGAGLDAHAMDPARVLATLGSIGGHLPARTLLVGCQVADVGEGMGLTPAVEASVDPAARTVRSILGSRDHAQIVHRTASAQDSEVG